MSFHRPTNSVVLVEPLVPSYMKLTQKSDVRNGKMVHFSEFVKSSLDSQFAGIDATDFSISNYIAMGVVDQLKPTVFNGSSVSAVDAVESVVSALSDPNLTVEND